MSGWLCRPLHGLIWLVGVRRARQFDRDARNAAYDSAVFHAIGNGDLLKPLPRKGKS